MSEQYFQSDAHKLHHARAREIIKDHPEVKGLMKPEPKTFFWIIAVVTFQIVMAALFNNIAVGWLILGAYCIGAFANHSLFVLIHDCTHNAIFKRRNHNILAGIIADLPQVLPTFFSFRHYHLQHHSYLATFEGDPDVPRDWETKLGSNPLGKALWLFLFPFMQVARLFTLPIKKPVAKNWLFLNYAVVIIFDLAIYFLIGPQALLYLFLSFFFSVGLHPLGARWLQEHHIAEHPQMTCNYYGPLNKLAFNIGYHNEHHDFPLMPWSNLPKLRAMAPEHYNHLQYITSWTGLFFRFIFCKKYNLATRHLRPLDTK